jgi:trans-aconitate methyltransferase
VTVLAGPNLRHLAIRDWLVRFGLKPGMDVYEIGCGSGQVTELICDVLDGQGSVLAVDVDMEKVIDAAERVSSRGNVSVCCEDAADFFPEPDFDVVVLPDVLEHIEPIRHLRLFQILASCLRPGGFVFIHIPNPLFLAWIHENHPELLQKPFDEPVHTRDLLEVAEQAGLVLCHLETYEVWQTNDYQAIMLRHLVAASEFRLDA